MKYTKLLSKSSTDFWVSVKCTKFVMDEMYEIGIFLAEFEYEYCRICVVSVVRAQILVTSEIHVDDVVLVVWVVRVCLVVWYV